MTVEDRLKTAMLNFLLDTGVRAVEVVSWDEDIEVGGYCNTCFYEDKVVRINYRDKKKSKVLRIWTYRGSFGDLISALDRLSE